MRRIVSYDISNNRVRRQVAKRLQRCGRRLQKSVFSVAVDRRGFKRLLNDLEHITKGKESILVIPLCENCSQRSTRLGPVPPICHIV